MPRIESANPAEVNTPLQPIFPRVVAAAYMVAPNRREAIENVVNQHNLRIELHETTGEFRMAAVCSSFNPRLSVGLGALERVWAAAFGYNVLFEVSVEQHRQRLAGEALPNNATHPAMEAAVTLLQWAFAITNGDLRQPWPDAPSPSRPFTDTNLMDRVESCFIIIVGWMLLHEIGHFACGHCAPPESSAPDDAANLHLHEFEADHWASAQMTAVADQQMRDTNICSIPFALGVIAGLNHRETDEHPTLISRLRRYMAEFVTAIATTRPEVVATANMTAIVPLQALIILRQLDPRNPPVCANLDDFLEWWETTMNSGGPIQP